MSGKILVQLMDTVKNALSNQIEISEVKYWLDGKTALYWIYNAGEWKQFVQLRINEILKLSEQSSWNHCPGKENPADLGSRMAKIRGIYLSDSRSLLIVIFDSEPIVNSSRYTAVNS